MYAARAAASDFTQSLASRVDGFTARQPDAYWLWHPIPDDPFLSIAKRHRPDLLTAISAVAPDDEAAALAVEELHANWTVPGIADHPGWPDAPSPSRHALTESIA